VSGETTGTSGVVSSGQPQADDGPAVGLYGETMMANEVVRREGGWVPRLRGWRADAAIALGVAAATVVFTHFAAHRQPDRRGLDALGYGLLVAASLALFVRRRYPVAVYLLAFAATLTYSSIGYAKGPIFFALIVAFFAVIRAGRRAVAMVGLAAGYVLFLWLPFWLGKESAPTLGQAVGLAAWLLLLAAAAEFLTQRRVRAAAAARMREEEARRRATEARLKIARDLHDVLGHHISLISVQAGVALHLIDERPEQVRTALAAIKQASKEALTELRGVLDVLRADDEHAPRTPTPTLAQLDQLVSRATAVGLQVRTEIDGAARPVPSGVDAAAFRIAQEALTNVARHAGAASAVVRLSYGEHELTVQIDDDGRGPSGHADGGQARAGTGIAGMRERAEALGGDVEVGPRPGGGFRVRARLPVEEHA
jgi:signal transduction histidine kinase